MGKRKREERWALWEIYEPAIDDTTNWLFRQFINEITRKIKARFTAIQIQQGESNRWEDGERAAFYDLRDRFTSLANLRRRERALSTTEVQDRLRLGASGPIDADMRRMCRRVLVAGKLLPRAYHRRWIPEDGEQVDFTLHFIDSLPRRIGPPLSEAHRHIRSRLLNVSGLILRGRDITLAPYRSSRSAARKYGTSKLKIEVHQLLPRDSHGHTTL